MQNSVLKLLESAKINYDLMPIDVTCTQDTDPATSLYITQTYTCGRERDNTVVISLDIQKTSVMITVYYYVHLTIRFCGSRTFSRPLCVQEILLFPPSVCKSTANDGKTSFATYEDGYVFYGDRDAPDNEYIDRVTRVAFSKADMDELLTFI